MPVELKEEGQSAASPIEVSPDTGTQEVMTYVMVLESSDMASAPKDGG